MIERIYPASWSTENMRHCAPGISGSLLSLTGSSPTNRCSATPTVRMNNDAARTGATTCGLVDAFSTICEKYQSVMKDLQADMMAADNGARQEGFRRRIARKNIGLHRGLEIRQQFRIQAKTRGRG